MVRPCNYFGGNIQISKINFSKNNQVGIGFTTVRLTFLYLTNTILVVL